MIVYLDANIVMYLVEARPHFGPRAAVRIAQSRLNGDTLAVSDLTRMECRVSPLSMGNSVVLADFNTFFQAPDLAVVGMTAAVCDRAAVIHAAHRFKPLDALHLAAAGYTAATGSSPTTRA